jgi:hypothetical protein
MLNSFRCLFIGAMAQISSASERKSYYAARCNQIKKIFRVTMNLFQDLA